MSDIFARRLKAEREKRGWTQQYMAGLLGISNGALSGYERNYREPDFETLTKIAKLFGVSTDWLLGLDHPPVTGPIAAHDEGPMGDDIDLDDILAEKFKDFLKWKREREKREAEQKK